MIKKTLMIPLLFTTLATLNIEARAADANAPATPDSPSQPLMDHSPADGKAMRMMKQRKAKADENATEASEKAAGNGDHHELMDHSAADAKAMRAMKHKKSKEQEGEAASQEPCNEHVMMDHSQADTKAMRAMKDKAVKTHKEGNCKHLDADEEAAGSKK